MSGSFWKFSNGFTSLSNISTLLENYNINFQSGDDSECFDVLLKLLDENDLLQELLSNNPMLLEFLRDDTVLKMLVELIISDGETPLFHVASDEKGTVSDDSDSEETPEEKKDTATDSADNSLVKSDEEDAEEDEEETEPQETPEEIASRRASIAAEILSADVWSLTDTVMESTSNLDKLWSILDSKEPLSIESSNYFMKIMEHLLDMKCDEMISYLIDHQSNLVEKFMNHLSNPPLMDFLLKLISTDKPDNSTGIIDYLQRQDLITRLINALDIENDSEACGKTDNEEQNDDDNYMSVVRQSSAADFLKALITISANSTTDNSTIGPNELTRELVSLEQMNRLCNIMLKGGYALANGVGIIIEIIRKNNSDYDILPVLYITLESHPPTGRDPIYLGHLLKVFGSKIKDFNEILMDKHTTNGEANTLKTPFGEIEPLGFERFKICELIAELLHCSNMALLNDNKGFDVVKERDELRNKIKEFDPVSFKYNEVVVLPDQKQGEDGKDDDDFANDTIDSFNKNDSVVKNEPDEDEPHANANLTEEQIRANPVVGDYLKISLFDTQIISNILSMFFKFPWNNFLHNVVFDIVQQVLNGSMDIGFNKFLAIDLFHLGDITNKIVEGQRLCTEYEETHNGLRLGFMGHLTLIAEEVVKFIQLYPTSTLSELIDVKIEDEVWDEYVNHVLYDTREKYNAILGGDEEDDDEEDDDEENNTFDEGLGDIIEEVKTGLVFDSTVDHDIAGSGFQDIEHARDDEDDNNTPNANDDSESDDDEHFRNYMSQQLTNTASTEIVSSVEVAKIQSTSHEFLQEKFENEDNEVGDDEYIDPNDDGCSYKKQHSLYDATGSLLQHKVDDDDLFSEDSSSSSSDNDDELAEEDKEEASVTNKLTRAASKS
jgi:SIT4-associating protein SAP185/190